MHILWAFPAIRGQMLPHGSLRVNSRFGRRQMEHSLRVMRSLLFRTLLAPLAQHGTRRSGCRTESKVTGLRRFVSLIVILATLSAPVLADSLLDNLDGTVTQMKSDGTKLMWMQDANYAMTSGFDADGQITQAQALSWASSLTFAGYTDWRLPVTFQNAAGGGGYNSNSEMGDLYYNALGNTAGSFVNAGSFFNIMPYWYWTSVDFVDPNFVMVFSFLDIPTSPQNEAGWEDAGGKFGVTYSWLVRDATNDPIRPVPEPATVFFVGLGIAGLAVARRRSVY